MATAPPDAGALPEDISHALRDVREHFAAVIESLCGSGSRAKDVSESFGLHAKLGWQIWNVAYTDPKNAIRHLPNEHGLQVWRRAAAERRVPSALLESLAGSVERARAVVEVHAEDREMFEMLVDGSEVGDEETGLRWRRQAFNGNSYMFGVRARCQLATAIFLPAEGSRFSIMRLQGLMDVVRTRVGVRWPISTVHVEQVDRTPTQPRTEAIVPGELVPLMPEFCSSPLPTVVRSDDGITIRDELMPGTVGRTGASTVVLGEILHSIAPAHGEAEGQVAHFGTGVRTPVELLVTDHFVHHSLFPGAKRDLRVYSELSAPHTRDDRDRLEVPEQVQSLGRGLLRVSTAEVPRYQDLLEAAFARVGADPNDFDVYRVRMRYPPMPTSVMLRMILPPPPGHS